MLYNCSQMTSKESPVINQKECMKLSSAVFVSSSSSNFFEPSCTSSISSASCISNEKDVSDSSYVLSSTSIEPESLKKKILSNTDCSSFTFSSFSTVTSCCSSNYSASSVDSSFSSEKRSSDPVLKLFLKDPYNNVNNIKGSSNLYKKEIEKDNALDNGTCNTNKNSKINHIGVLNSKDNFNTKHQNFNMKKNNYAEKQSHVLRIPNNGIESSLADKVPSSSSSTYRIPDSSSLSSFTSSSCFSTNSGVNSNTNSFSKTSTLLKSKNIGSNTCVEEVDKVKKRNKNYNFSTSSSSSPFANKTPILKLNVHPQTKDVLNTLDKKKMHEEKEKDQEEIKDELDYVEEKMKNSCFLFKKSESSAVIVEHLDYCEVYDANEGGLSWGEKRANDGSWKEKWLQQKITTKDKDGNVKNSKFGRSSGKNDRLKKKWTDRWEHNGDDLNVEKHVQVFDQNEENIIEEWKEIHVENMKKGISKLVKEGKDVSHGVDKPRYWTESTFRRVGLDGREIEFETEFEQKEDKITVGKRFSKSLDGIEHTIIWYKSKKEKMQEELNEYEEEWEDEFFLNKNDGSKWGNKRGVNKKGEEWSEKWIEEAQDGNEDEKSKKIEKYSKNYEKTKMWGEKYEFDKKTNEIVNERWEKQCNIDESESTLILEKNCCKKNEENTWGEKITIKQKYELGKKVFLLNKFCDADLDEEDQTFITNFQKTKEKWHKNAEEKICNASLTEKEFKKNSMNNIPTVSMQREQESIKGEKYEDGSEWGEKSFKVFENSKDNVVEKNDSDKLLNTSEQRESSSVPVLQLRVKGYDKWWKERTGNQWGEKFTQNITENMDEKEVWYDNGYEKQVDRWTHKADGSKFGEKFGAKVNGSSWSEKWSSGANGENSWIDKSWRENVDGQLKDWGETVKAENGKKWSKNWWKYKNFEENEGEEFTKMFDDDGMGNRKTEKEGCKWRNVDGGRETTSWFHDRFGECTEQQEKWAYKEGYNRLSGDQWMEKWNEFPHCKSACKTGLNNNGDEWHEEWKEDFLEDGKKKTQAKKSGKNSEGNEWIESWIEDNENKKTAKKYGKNANGEEWEEEWGEDIKEDGSGEKWTRKWSKKSDGNRSGESWGDRWGTGGVGGHHWGEKWLNENVHKWWKDTDGRPPGC